MKKTVNKRSSEHGGAGVKFLSVLVVLILVANAGYNFIPVAYNGENFKQEMQTAVVQGVALPESKKSPLETVKKRLQVSAQTNKLPDDAVIDVKMLNNVVSAHVTYSKEVPILPFGIYNYQYNFDHTATPTGFLMKQ